MQKYNDPFLSRSKKKHKQNLPRPSPDAVAHFLCVTKIPRGKDNLLDVDTPEFRAVFVP